MHKNGIKTMESPLRNKIEALEHILHLFPPLGGVTGGAPNLAFLLYALTIVETYSH